MSTVTIARLTLAAAGMMLIALPATAGNPADNMAELTCRDLKNRIEAQAVSPERRQMEAVSTIAWLDGYVSGEQSAPMVDGKRLRMVLDHVVKACDDNHDAKVLDLVREARH